jgi:hypothetical protein
MATLVLTAVGTAVAGPIGGAIGAIIGQSADAALFAPKARHGPRMGDLAVQTSSYGTSIPKLFGTMRAAGTVVWSTDLIEKRTTTSSGKGRPKSVDYSYSASFAVALSARPILEVRRIWADGKLLRGAAGDFKTKCKFRLWQGSEDQPVDPLITAAEGEGNAPAFRGIAYALFEELELADFGNRIPSLSFEVVADAGLVEVGAIAAELGEGEIVAGPTEALHGYAASGGSVRGALAELGELMALPIVDDGARLRLGNSGAVQMLPAAFESGEREVQRGSAAAAPGEVTIAYYDAARDYQSGLQRALADTQPGAVSERRALPAVLAAAQAKRLAERRLDHLWSERVTAKVICGWGAAGIGPGARVMLAGEQGLWRVRRRTLGPMRVTFDLTRCGEDEGAAAAANPGRNQAEPDLPHGPTILRIHELPIPDPSRDEPVLVALAAGNSAGWRRAALSASFDDGASWSDIGTTAAPAIIGSAAAALGGGGAALFDEQASVEVELLNEEMNLLSRDDEALVRGANLALVGRELIQFGRAEALGGRRFRLSRLLRGRFGTEWAATEHAAGEEFALIETVSAARIDLPQGMGAGAELRLLASGVGDEEAAEAIAAVRGDALLPPSVVHVRSADGPDGDITIRWVRRSRRGWTWGAEAETPIGEEREAYRMTFTAAGGSRTVETAQPMHLYTAAEQAADGGPVTVEIAQIGTHGVSRPAAIVIP